MNWKSIKLVRRNKKLSLDLQYANAKTQIDNSLVSIKTKENYVSLTNTNNNYIQGLFLTELLRSRK
jgi:hypothetical protein